GIRHHLETFNGGHSWAPDSICADALTWMELQAMRDRRLAIDRRWVDSLFTDAGNRAAGLSPTNPYAASILYERSASDFAGLRDTSGLKENARRLAESEPVKLIVKRLNELASEAESFQRRENSFFDRFATGSQGAAIQSLRQDLSL